LRDVPICRAAFGALESMLAPAPYSVMEREPNAGGHRAQRRARRWAREIMLAVMLTAAAAAFIAAALLRGSDAPPVETARKPMAK